MGTATETCIDEHEERYSLTRLLREHDYAAGLIAGLHLEAKLRQCHNPGIVSMITRSRTGNGCARYGPAPG